MSASLHRSVVLLLTLTGLLSAVSAARADCVDGVRKATAAEIDFLQRANAALIAGLPEAVRPLERNNPQRPEPGAVGAPTLCAGSPVGAFSPGAFTAFNFNFSPEEAKARAEQRRLLRQQIDELKKLPSDKEAEVRQLTEQARAAAASAPRRSRKDPPFTPEQQAQVERAETEANRLAQAARKIQFDHEASVKPQTDALNERADRLQAGQQTFTVRLSMNAQRFAAAVPASEVITFGAPSANRSGSLRGRNVMVEVQGPAGPTRDAVVALIDQAYLQSLIDAPLPAVTASRQRIEANIARAASAPPLAIASTVPLNPSSTAAPAAAFVDPAAASASAASATKAAATAAQSSSPAAPATTTAQNPCPPPSRAAGGTATASGDAARTGRDVGGEVGGAILGGGWGRSVGSSVGGVLGALGGGAKKDEPKPATAAADCPR